MLPQVGCCDSSSGAMPTMRAIRWRGMPSSSRRFCSSIANGPVAREEPQRDLRLSGETRGRGQICRRTRPARVGRASLAPSLHACGWRRRDGWARLQNLSADAIRGVLGPMSYNFDGVDDYLLSSPNQIVGTQYSIAAWFDADSKGRSEEHTSGLQ